MNRSTFLITQMDCPSEENLIRMKLEGISNIAHLEFDIPNRELAVFHEAGSEEIEHALEALKLGSKLISTETTERSDFDSDSHQRKLLWSVLGINFAFFIIEMITGIFSRSMGLVADSLDMLADSFVYGISLLAVGSTVVRKKQIAKIAGYFQILLAVVGFAEVSRRFIIGEELPDFTTMLVVSIFALGANALCLYILQKSKNSKEAHMQASMIFTSNDVIINLGVIVASIAVFFTESNLPDLLVGTIVFVLVIRGALRILKLGK